MTRFRTRRGRKAAFAMFRHRSREATMPYRYTYRDNQRWLNRYLHQASGPVGRRQPADSADRLARRQRPADPAISETVEHGDQRHDRLSGRVRQPDSGLHHHADRAGDRLRRRRRLHHVVVRAGHQHDPGLRQAEFDPNQALTEVLAKTNSVKYLIPKESNDPIVTKTTGSTTAVMYLGFPATNCPVRRSRII